MHNLHVNMAEPQDLNADPSAIGDWIRRFDVSVFIYEVITDGCTDMAVRLRR
jgi:hypothetical protein